MTVVKKKYVKSQIGCGQRVWSTEMKFFKICIAGPWLCSCAGVRLPIGGLADLSTPVPIYHIQNV